MKKRLRSTTSNTSYTLVIVSYVRENLHVYARIGITIFHLLTKNNGDFFYLSVHDTTETHIIMSLDRVSQAKTHKKQSWNTSSDATGNFS